MVVIFIAGMLDFGHVLGNIAPSLVELLDDFAWYMPLIGVCAVRWSQ